MRLARKLTIALVLGITAVMATNAVLQVRREARQFEFDSRRDQHAVGRVLQAAVEAIWPAEGEAAARRLITEASRDNPDLMMRLVWLAPGAEADATPLVDRDALAAVAAGEEVVVTADERRFTYLPLFVEAPYPGALEVSESLSHERRFVRATGLMVAAATLVMVVLCAAIALGLGFWFVGRPIQALCDKARRVGRGDFSGPLVVRQRDEIGELAGELNVMCEHLAQATQARVAALEQLRHADRLKTVGQLASGVAHELGTPLNVVSGRARMIAQGMVTGDAAHDSARIIVEQAARITAIIRQLLDFSRRRGPSLGAGDLRPLAQRTAELLTALARRRGVTLALETPAEALIAEIDPGQIQQVLTNLMVNGIQAMPDGGTLTLRLERRQAVPPSDVGGAAAEFVTVTVEDQGVGISPEHLPHLFEPFFTTKDVGEGTGLGLSVAYGIVREHGGWIHVDSEPGRGARFTCFLRPASGALQEIPA